LPAGFVERPRERSQPPRSRAGPDGTATGAFISTIGVLSGALAGGLEDRTVLSHLALFADRP